jgi:hypothetical protein
MITDHLPRIGRKRPVVLPSDATETQNIPKPDYWAMDCAANPWRKGCRTYDS